MRQPPTRDAFRAYLVAKGATEEQAATMVRMEFDGLRGDDSLTVWMYAHDHYLRLAGIVVVVLDPLSALVASAEQGWKDSGTNPSQAVAEADKSQDRNSEVDKRGQA